jgi:hypothetical protein
MGRGGGVGVGERAAGLQLRVSYSPVKPFIIECLELGRGLPGAEMKKIDQNIIRKGLTKDTELGTRRTGIYVCRFRKYL